MARGRPKPRGRPRPRPRPKPKPTPRPKTPAQERPPEGTRLLQERARQARQERARAKAAPPEAPYDLYLPTITRQPTWATTPGYGTQPRGYKSRLVATRQPGYAELLRQRQPAAPPTGGGGGRTWKAPPGLEGWYQAFMGEHGGQTPEEFYERTGEGLAEALADREWSQGFAQMYGRPPNDYDWANHWYATRRGYRRGGGGGGGGGGPRPPTYMPQRITWR